MRNLPAYCLLLIIVVAVAAFFIVPRQAPIISTDLKDLSPELVDQPAIKTVINTLTRDVQSHFLLLVMGDTEAQVTTATQRLETELAQANDLLSVIDNNAMIDKLLPLFKAHRFNLLTDTQVQKLQTSSDETLLSNAQAELFASMSTRVLPVTDDPFNVLTPYLSEKLEHMHRATSVFRTDNGQWASVITIAIEAPVLDMNTQQSIVERTQRAIDSLDSVSVYRSGVVFFAAKAASTTKADIQWITSVSLGCVILLLWAVFRSPGPLLVASLSIGLGMVIALLASVVLFGSVHIITIVFGASLIGVVIDYAIHYFYHRAQSNTTRQLMRSLLLSLLTSVIGYSALAWSDLVSLKRVAVFSGTGLIVAWLSVVVLGSKLAPKPLNTQWISAGVEHFERFIIQPLARYAYTIMSVIVVGFVAVLVWGLPFNDSPGQFFAVDQDLLQQEQQVAEVSQDFEPGNYIIVEGDSVDKVFERLAQLNSLQPGLHAINELLPSPMQQRTHYALNQRLYGNGGLAEQFYRSIGASTDLATQLATTYQAADAVLLPRQLFDQVPELPTLWFEINKRHYTIVRIPKGLTLNTELQREHSRWQFVNTRELATQALQQQRQSAMSLLAVAYLLVAAMLLFVYRQWQAVQLLLVPALATMTVFITLTLLQQPITLFHTMALFLVLGLGMDYMIFMFDMKKTPAIGSTQQAIVLSALTSCLSFGLLSISELSVVSGFGLTLLIGNTANLLYAFVLHGRTSLSGSALFKTSHSIKETL